ncbi:metallophosphoesterase family protein [Phenylobacterium sp.]|uniref:metallophosphoesterase family protein n=1 Tax=Phenylobacterium sp. TaxID=1871053 RepID=UPI0035AFE654
MTLATLARPEPRSPAPERAFAPEAAPAPAAAPSLAEALRQVRADLAAACAPRLLGDRAAGPPPPDAVRLVAPGRRARLKLRGRIGPRRTGGPAATAGQLVYAVGDLHGRYDLFLDLMARLSADSAARAAGRAPVLVLLGDYVDRGPDSARVLEALVWLGQATDWWVVALKGNHEQALLRFLDEPELGVPWLRFGGGATLRSYGVEPPRAEEGTCGLVRARDELMAAMPAAHLRRLQTLELAATVGDYAFVHAGVAPGVALEAQQEADLLWIRDEFLGTDRAGGALPSGQVVVHGHTRTGVRPQLEPHRIGLDTGAYETGVLTAARLDGAEVAVLQEGAAPEPEPAPEPPPPAPRPWTPVSRPTDFTRGLGY